MEEIPQWVTGPANTLLFWRNHIRKGAAMKITDIIKQVNIEGNLKAQQAKTRDELAEIIHEDYFISWLSAFCVAGVLLSGAKTKLN